MLTLIESSRALAAGGSAALHNFMTADAWGWTYVASRDELLATGVCTPAHFPGGRKRSAWNSQDGPGRQWTLMKLNGGLWQLRILRTQDERAEFEAQQLSREAGRRRSELTEDRWKNNQAFLLGVFMDGLRGDGIVKSFQLSERDQDTVQALAQRMLMVINAANPERIDSPPVGETTELQPALRAPLRVAWGAASPDRQ